jgi:3-deoxy-D-manno-octulosonic-acid transferase
MYLLYNTSIFLYKILLSIASIFDSKAKKWVDGRKTQTIPNLKYEKVIWMHCSSLGEFEQGKPVLEELKKQKPKYTFVLTFFSPSGYERLKNTDIADHVLYLPIDLPSKANDFIEKINPELSIFVKYDFWYNYLKVLNSSNRKVIFISVLLNEKHRLFNSFNTIILNQLRKVNKIFTQDDKSALILENNGFNNAKKTGDTRVDRVLELANTPFSDSIIENFINREKKILICGSTWEKDIELLSKIKDSILNEYQLIIAPHEISKKQINQIFNKFNNREIIKYSTWEKDGDFDLLIVDKIGILSRIYRYANLAYIGGGFGKGIHNTLEPASYKIPVIIGAKYSRFYEAVNLVGNKSFFSVSNESQINEILLSLNNIEVYINAIKGIESFFTENKGASKQIVSYIAMQTNIDEK